MSSALGKGGQTPAGQTTTTQTQPSYMYPYIGTALSQAGSLLGNNGPQYYPGQTAAGFSQPQQRAMQGIVDLGMNGSPGLSAAQGFDQTLLHGGGSNPYLDAAFQQAAGATQNQLSSEFAGMGRNAVASEPLRAEQLNNLATGLYGGNYQNTLNDALQAGNQAQGLYGTQMQGLQAAEGVGEKVQNLAQQQMNANQQQYNYYQQLPYQQLQQYERFLQGVNPGQQTSTPYFTNPTASALGTGLAAQQLYNGYQGKGGTSLQPTDIDSMIANDPNNPYQSGYQFASQLPSVSGP